MWTNEEQVDYHRLIVLNQWGDVVRDILCKDKPSAQTFAAEYHSQGLYTRIERDHEDNQTDSNT